MLCARRRFRFALGAACAALGTTVAVAPASAAPDAGEPAAGKSDEVPTVRLEAAGGVGWATGSSDLQWRRMSEVRAEVSYLKSEGALVGLRGLYQDGERSYTPTSPAVPGLGPLPIIERERRLAIGGFVGWDPLHSWAVPSRHRAGFVLLVMKLDVDQLMNRVAPLVGVEPGAGFQSYVRLAGPVTLSGGASYQWVTNFSARSATARVVRGTPYGTLRYDARLGLVLGRTVLDVRYAGERFEFEHESTTTHSLLFGVSFDA